MRRRAASLMLLCSCAIGVAGILGPSLTMAQGAPDAAQVVENMLRMRAERLEGVNDYTLVQTVNGAEATVYFERMNSGGQPEFRIVMPQEYQKKALEEAGLSGGLPGQGGGTGASGIPGQQGIAGGLPALLEGLPLVDALPKLPGVPTAGGTEGSFLQKAGGVALGAATGGLQQQLMQKAGQGVIGLVASQGEGETDGAVFPTRLIAEFGRVARLDGIESVDGTRCYLLRAEIRDPEVGRRLSGGQDFTVKAIALWVDTETHVPRRAVAAGTIMIDGREQELTLDVSSQDYRRVERMYEPFRVVLRISGMSDALTAADPAKAEQISKDAREAAAKMTQLEEMLARMPPEQRRMAEAQMGVARERLNRFSTGGFDNVETVTEVRELRVNAGPPTPFGTGEVAAEGAARLALPKVIVQVSPAAEATGQRGWLIHVIGAREGHGGGVVQLKAPGDLPRSGDASGSGDASFRLADGKQAQVSSSENGATVRITSRTLTRITGEFTFRGSGRVGDVDGATLTVRGRFSAPIPPASTGIPSGVTGRR